MSEFVRITDQSSAADARRRLRRVAAAEDFDSDTIERAAIVATEAATNIVRYAGRGNILIDTMPLFGTKKLVIIAMDKGSGIAKLERMMRDGESTGGGSGTGLGAMQRLSDRFDIHTEPGAGTVVACEFGPSASDGKTRRFDAAGLRLNHPGESECGDAWLLRTTGRSSQFFLCDGLGHGPRAAEAANRAIEGLKNHGGAPVETILDDLSHTMRPTRGAVAALCQVEGESPTMTYGGIGNISTLHLSNGAIRRLASRDGRLGAVERRAMVETLDIQPGDTVVMHTDGISTLRGFESRTGLLRRSALTIAGVILRDHLRGRDDAGIVVVKIRKDQDQR
ncbi:ATP-binding protein [Oricola cellulosilytica]|uniref:Histidine kinase n=1 Tax=Oricola cellulosilytica TaxID=1429082 RepID=A0A4R0PHV0_9HYPH|nr:ATP-binding protein [Oricola cellulosilytica]TCD16140.1 histidine kinase [Oricola cellulosilytica]